MVVFKYLFFLAVKQTKTLGGGGFANIVGFAQYPECIYSFRVHQTRFRGPSHMPCALVRYFGQPIPSYEGTKLVTNKCIQYFPHLFSTREYVSLASPKP